MEYTLNVFFEIFSWRALSLCGGFLFLRLLFAFSFSVPSVSLWLFYYLFLFTFHGFFTVSRTSLLSAPHSGR